MPTLQNEVFKYGKRYYYPHMKPADIVIWERFMEANPDAYDNVQYDVPVGNVPDHALEPLSDLGGTAEKLYKRKIDVVGFKGEKIDIIELKPNAGLSSIGQVDGYRVLYTRDYTPPTRCGARVITDAADPDTKHYAAEKDVEVIVV